MELALSVGCSNSIRKQSFGFNGRDDEEEGEDPIPLDLKLSWSTDSGPSSSESLRAAAGKHDWDGGCWRFSDEEEGGTAKTKKKLRLSKEQSSYLEESFREHHTLNPKEKLALAKQLHLRPRQVEVWFQNRRARTKLKQMDMDCQYLKHCCESLTEENRRLHKELRELKAFKALVPYHHPPHMCHVPATTLTMCSSCEHLASPTIDARNNSGGSPVAKSRFCPP